MKLALAILLAAIAVHADVPPVVIPPAKSVTLAFDASIDPTVTGYKLEWRDEAGVTNSQDVGMTITNSVNLGPVVAGESFKFWAVSYNGQGLESIPSNEISYTVPVTPEPKMMSIVLWTGPNAQGPWPTSLTTNRIPATNAGASYRQTITLE